MIRKEKQQLSSMVIWKRCCFMYDTWKKRMFKYECVLKNIFTFRVWFLRHYFHLQYDMQNQLLTLRMKCKKHFLSLCKIGENGFLIYEWTDVFVTLFLIFESIAIPSGHTPVLKKPVTPSGVIWRPRFGSQAAPPKNPSGRDTRGTFTTYPGSSKRHRTT